MELGGFSSQEELREWVDDYCNRFESAEYRRLDFYFAVIHSVNGIKTALRGNHEQSEQPI